MEDRTDGIETRAPRQKSGQEGNGGQAGKRETPRKEASRSIKDTGCAEGQRRRLQPRGLPSLRSRSSPRGSGGELKMKHLVPGPKDVTLGRRGLGRLPRGNGRVPGVGGAQHKLLLPPPPQSGRARASEPSGAVERQCPLVATAPGLPGGSGHLQNWVGRGTSWALDTGRRQVRHRAQGMGQGLCQRPPRLSSITRQKNSYACGFSINLCHPFKQST